MIEVGDRRSFEKWKIAIGIRSAETEIICRYRLLANVSMFSVFLLNCVPVSKWSLLFSNRRFYLVIRMTAISHDGTQ